MIQLPNIPTFSEYKFLNEQQESFNILIESLATAKKLFLTTGKIDKNDFDKLVNIDISKTKKYLDKLCKFFLDGIDFDELEIQISIYDTLINKNQIKEKDINTFKNYKDFSTFIDKHKDTKSKTEIENIKKVKELDVILDNDKFLIVSPRSHSMSCVYGAGTKWCIAGRDDYYWNDYTNQFVEFYFIIQKGMDSKKPLYKIAVAVYPDEKETKEVFDANDKEIDFKVVTKLGLDVNIFKKLDMDKILPDFWLKKWTKGKISFNSDGSIDVDGDVDIRHFDLTKLPFKFNKVTGYFACTFRNLTTLEGCPNEVGRDFDCGSNQLTSLDFAPQKVGGNFVCPDNQLTSLNGAPKEVGGDFIASRNNIKDLKGIPEKIGGSFVIVGNKTTFTKNDVKKVSKVKGNILV